MTLVCLVPIIPCHLISIIISKIFCIYLYQISIIHHPSMSPLSKIPYILVGKMGLAFETMVLYIAVREYRYK